MLALKKNDCCHEAAPHCENHSTHRNHPVIVGLLALLDVLVFSAPTETYASNDPEPKVGMHLLSEFGFVLERTRHTARIRGEVENFEVLHRKDRHRGNYEVDIQMKYSSGLNRVGYRSVLRGRDLDGDGTIDTWFYLGPDHHIEVIDDEHEYAKLGDPAMVRAAAALNHDLSVDSRWGFFRAQQILETQGVGQDPTLEYRFGDWVLNYASWAYSRRGNVIAEQIEQEIRLRSAEVVADRLEAQAAQTGRSSDLFRAEQLRRVTLEGWKESERVARESLHSGIIKYVVADIAAYVLGAKVGQAIGRSASAVWARALSRNSLLRALESSVSGWIEAGEKRAVRAVKALEEKLSGGAVGKVFAHTSVQAIRTASVTAREQSWQMVQKLEAKGRMGRVASRSLLRAAVGGGNVLKAGAYATSAQLRADVSARENWDKISADWDESSWDNIVLIDTHVADARDMLYHVSHLTPQTLLVSNVRAYTNLKSNAALPRSQTIAQTVGHKLTIGAVIGLTERAAITAITQGSTERRNVAFQTLWQGVTGTLHSTTDQVVRSRYDLQGYALVMNGDEATSANSDLTARLKNGETFDVVPIFSLRKN